MKTSALTATLMMLAAPGFAHTGHGEAAGLAAGLLHPVLGADHVLAVAAVGLWSGFVLPRLPWAGGAAFLAAMIGGAGLSLAGLGMPAREAAILASVVIFGLLVLLSRPGQGKAVTGLSLVAIAAFGAAHGHAHATEASGAVLPFLAGVIAATAILHVTGLGLARLALTWKASRTAQRGFGVAIAAIGAVLAAVQAG